MIEFVRTGDVVRVQINNFEYDISRDNWITMHSIQKCKSESEASWLCSILNDAMERVERKFMIEKEDWLNRHPKASEKDWLEFIHYCCNRGFKFGNTKSDQEMIFAPACGLSEDFLRKRDENSEGSSQLS